MDATTRPVLKVAHYGVYFGLPFEEYLADDALGSSDLRYLRRNPTSYWRNSRRNPKYKAKNADYLTRGTAMHTLMFEGNRAFSDQYMRGAEHTEDMTPAEKGALTKEVNKKAAALGMTALPAADYDRVLEARTIIKLNPDMQSLFENGFPEVSIFWSSYGIRLKARIDYLKVRGIGDLKSVSNPYDDEFESCCRRAISNYGYHIQAAHYLEARAQLPGLVAQGLVFGEHDKSLLQEVVQNEGIGWQWLFYCTEGPPDAFSYKITHGNEMIEIGKRSVQLALARYVKFDTYFGDRQWVLVKKTQDLTPDMMPPWFDRMTDEDREELAIWMTNRG